MTTSKKKPKTLDKKKDIKKDGKHITKFAPFDAIILYPSLGCPALVKIEENGDAWLEMMIVTVFNNLTPGQIAFHLRYSEWALCHGNKNNYKPLNIYTDYFAKHTISDKNENMVKLSEPFLNINDQISVESVLDDTFKLQLAHMSMFPWVLQSYREKGYKYIYKIGINLKYEKECAHNGTLWNFFWIKTDLYYLSQGKPKMLGVVSDWIDNFFIKKYKTKLSSFGDKMKGDKKTVLKDSEEITATWYNPVFVSKKAQLNIGHVTDIHLDTRMALFSQSVASVIEVKENCMDGVVIKNNDRVVKNNEFYKPLKKIAANFNEIFINTSKKLLKKADVLVITGDLIDYNKGIHTSQTVRPLTKKPSETWDALRSGWLRFDNEFHIEDRNWFMFYKLLLQLYDDHKKPIFTTLGNHDYVKHATAPWPLFGKAWNGVYDMNLTRYENALCFGAGYRDHKEFVRNISTSIDCVKWYTRFINPFPDYVIDYGGQSMFMVDWAEAGVFPAAGVANAVTKIPIRHPGTLHHAANMFLDKNEVQYTYKEKDKDGKETTISRKLSYLPFPIKNYSIYKSWLKHPAKVRMLFTHATSICPRDDVSVAEINKKLKWTAEALRYGTFDNRRDEILKDVENGRLHIIVGGHSHRNVVMAVNKDHAYYAHTLAAGEIMKTKFRKPAHLAMVTSSAGPFPKYLPGGPLICACPEEYTAGFFYEWDPSLHRMQIKQLYSATDHTKTPLDSDACPICGMKGKDMVRKPARRHAPGGNLLIFEDGKVKIESVVADHKTSDPDNMATRPRTAVMCEEQGVFTGDMRLDGINSFKDFNEWDYKSIINIISVNPFKYYGYMVFPSRVKYVTFNKGVLPGDDKVERIKADKKYEIRVRQTVIKDTFDAFFKAAKHDSDFGFTRYTFSRSDIWDREMNIGKELLADAKEWAKVKAHNANEASYAFMVEKTAKPDDTYRYEPKYLEYKKDDYRGMLLQFKTIPDFEKRKDSDVCGY